MLERALAVIETVEPVDQAARFDVAAAAAEGHYALAETDAVAVGSAVDAARRLRSGARMLRIAMARYNRGTGVTDPEGIELFDEALQLLDPDGDTAARLRHRITRRASLDPGRPGVHRRRRRGERVARRHRVERAQGRRRGSPVARFGHRWVFPAPPTGSACATRPWLSMPEAEDPWWAQLASGLDFAAVLHLLRGHSLMALGRRAEFETNLAQVTELGETTGNLSVLGAARARVVLLALLDGRFEDVPTSANRMLEAGARGQQPPRTSGSWGMVAIEEGRAAELLPMMEAALAISPDLPRSTPPPDASASTAVTTVARPRSSTTSSSGWTGLGPRLELAARARRTAELVAGLEATEHADVLADELGPYAGELVVVGAGILCVGAFDRYRGMVLGLLGRHDEAVAALTAALALEESIESPPFTARTRYWLARALLQRDDPGDRARVAVELDRSIQTAERLGMPALAAAGRAFAEPGG